jgi:hypothetical protein
MTENYNPSLSPLALFGFLIVEKFAFNLAHVVSIEAVEEGGFEICFSDTTERRLTGESARRFCEILGQIERQARFGGLTAQPPTVIRPN